MVVRAEVFVIDIHQALLGLVEQVDHVGGLVVGLGDGLGGDTNHLALDELLAQHADVILNVGSGDDILRELGDGISAASSLKFSIETQALHHR